jgi:hypothetical protein
MEVLILDNLLRPIDVVDQFESMIWAERRAAVGDCQLVTLSTFSNRRRFTPGTKIAITSSRRIVEIQTVTETVNDDGVTVLEIKGLEITDILRRRSAVKAVGAGIAPSWLIQGMAPADVMRHIFDEICVQGSVNETDILPFISPGNLYPIDTIPEPVDVIDWEQKPDSVLAAESEIADIYDLGFRLYKDPFLSKLYFNVYAGSDRTSAQTVLPAVIFSHDMESLQNTTEFTDIAETYNVIRVLYTYTVPGATEEDPDEEITLSLEVYDPANIPEGFDRRVKTLVISNVPEEITDIPAFLIQSGWAELMKSRPITAFDGEISQNSQYKYEVDYYMGDLVEVRSSTGATAFMRVEEYIFVQDKQGERSYPTLVTKAYKEPGTWESWKYDVEWDLFPEETWDEQ